MEITQEKSTEQHKGIKEGLNRSDTMKTSKLCIHHKYSGFWYSHWVTQLLGLSQGTVLCMRSGGNTQPTSHDWGQFSNVRRGTRALLLTYVFRCVHTYKNIYKNYPQALTLLTAFTGGSKTKWLEVELLQSRLLLPSSSSKELYPCLYGLPNHDFMGAEIWGGPLRDIHPPQTSSVLYLKDQCTLSFKNWPLIGNKFLLNT